MFSLNDIWRLRSELVFGSVLVAVFVVWALEANPLTLLYPIRLFFGLYLALFPAGFLAMALIFKERQDMNISDWLAYSVGINITIISLASIFANYFLGLVNSLDLVLKIIFAFSAFFFLLTKVRQIEL